MVLKVVSLFSGIGAYEKALDNIKRDYHLVNYCELDTIKSRAYSLLHNVSEDLNLKDVSLINTSKMEDFDLLVYSPPCQAFSVAGNRKGLEDIRGTLFYSALKVIQDKKPTYAIMENVANLPNKFKDEFKNMLNELDKAGYNNYWRVINAKDFIPQNRNRVYIVSILKEKDDGTFEFPIGTNNENWFDFIDPLDTRSLTPRQQLKIEEAKGNIQGGTTNLEGSVQFEQAVINLRQSGLRFQNNREFPTVTAFYGTGGGNFPMMAYKGHVGGIKPRTCFKLMGFDYEDSDLLTENRFSVSSQYRMAGDSVCVPVLENIFKNLNMEDLHN